MAGGVKAGNIVGAQHPGDIHLPGLQRADARGNFGQRVNAEPVNFGRAPCVGKFLGLHGFAGPTRDFKGPGADRFDRETFNPNVFLVIGIHYPEEGEPTVENRVRSRSGDLDGALVDLLGAGEAEEAR